MEGKGQKMINLGDRVKDPVTGVQGIAYVRSHYLQGCDRIGIQPPTLRKKGEIPVVPDLFHVDEPQLVVVRRNVIKQKSEGKDNGGPSFFGPRDYKK